MSIRNGKTARIYKRTAWKLNLDLFGFELTEDEMEQMKSLNRDEKHDWY